MDAMESIIAALQHNPRALEPQFSAFMSAMTGQVLYDKGDIAMVLAYLLKGHNRLQELSNRRAITKHVNRLQRPLSSRDRHHGIPMSELSTDRFMQLLCTFLEEFTRRNIKIYAEGINVKSVER